LPSTALFGGSLEAVWVDGFCKTEVRTLKVGRVYVSVVVSFLNRSTRDSYT